MNNTFFTQIQESDIQMRGPQRDQHPLRTVHGGQEPDPRQGKRWGNLGRS